MNVEGIGPLARGSCMKHPLLRYKFQYFEETMRTTETQKPRDETFETTP